MTDPTLNGGTGQGFIDPNLVIHGSCSSGVSNLYQDQDVSLQFPISDTEW